MTLFVFFSFFFFFKQKTAYEMRISDWSSDVCSSDLHPGAAGVLRPAQGLLAATGVGAALHRDRRWPWIAPLLLCGGVAAAQVTATGEIGRAACRERVCQYV